MYLCCVGYMYSCQIYYIYTNTYYCKYDCIVLLFVAYNMEHMINEFD